MPEASVGLKIIWQDASSVFVDQLRVDLSNCFFAYFDICGEFLQKLFVGFVGFGPDELMHKEEYRSDHCLRLFAFADGEIGNVPGSILGSTEDSWTAVVLHTVFLHVVRQSYRVLLHLSALFNASGKQSLFKINVIEDLGDTQVLLGVLCRVVHGSSNLILNVFAFEYAVFLNPFEEFLGSHQYISVTQVETFGQHANFLLSQRKNVVGHGPLDHVVVSKFVGLLTTT